MKTRAPNAAPADARSWVRAWRTHPFRVGAVFIIGAAIASAGAMFVESPARSRAASVSGNTVAAPARGTALRPTPSTAEADERAEREAREDADAAVAMPASLEGTEIDGALHVDASGHLVPGPEARWLFDYYLSAEGEESSERIVARLRSQLRSRLQEPARSEALTLLERYLAYRERGSTLEDTLDDGDAERRLLALHQLRRDVFGESTADALFAAEEAGDAVALERTRTLADESLDRATRAQTAEQLETSLPAPLRAQRAETLAPLRLHHEERDFRAAGGSAEALHRLRVERSGPEAAERLAQLDASRSDFQERLRAYRQERASLLQSPALDAAGRERATEALLLRSFSEPERRRVEALERMARP